MLAGGQQLVQLPVEPVPVHGAGLGQQQLLAPGCRQILSLMEELFEALCWSQLDFHSAPVAILNTNGFYDGLTGLLDGMVNQGFLSSSHRSIPHVAATVDELAEWLTRL